MLLCIFFFKQKTAYEMRISDWSSDVCSSDLICPANIPDDITEACKAIALRAHQLLGCKGTPRSAFRWDDERGVEGLFLLEVYTQPGMPPPSLVPEQAAKLAIDYAERVERIVGEEIGREAVRERVCKDV